MSVLSSPRERCTWWRTQLCQQSKEWAEKQVLQPQSSFQRLYLWETLSQNHPAKLFLIFPSLTNVWDQCFVLSC
jgi:hypothetical protein